MTNRALACAIAGLIAVPLIAGCGSSNSNSNSTASTSAAAPSTTPATTTTTTDSGSGPETIKAARKSVGVVLVDGEGKTLYLFEKDTGTTSMCSGACAQAWPPVTTDGAPTAGGGVQAALLTTSKRSDGTTQVVYGGHPLYYFVRDKDSGDAYGQGVSAFGADWYVVGPNGQKLEGHERKPSTTTTSGGSGGGGY